MVNCEQETLDLKLGPKNLTEEYSALLKKVYSYTSEQLKEIYDDAKLLYYTIKEKKPLQEFIDEIFYQEYTYQKEIKLLEQLIVM